MRYEREISLGGFLARVVREVEHSPANLVLDANENLKEYMQESLLRAGWEQDLAAFNIGIALWTKKLTRLTNRQLIQEAEELLGVLNFHNRMIIMDELHKRGLEA